MRVLFIIADSVRADRLGCYAGGNLTLTIDALADDGVRFETVRSSAPWTVPSIAAMLTGVWSHRLGLVKWEQPWNIRVPSIFDHCRQAGMQVASFVFDPAHLFVNCPAAGVIGSSQDTDKMLGWLEEQSRKQHAFTLVHYWWTHLPYLEKRQSLRNWNTLCKGMLALLADPDHGAQNKEKLEELYNHSINTFSEKWLPRIFEAARPDVLVLTSDHGESWGERMPAGTFPRDVFDLHGNHLYDEVIRIPWIIYAPEFLESTVVRGQARSIDIMPTLLDLISIPLLPDMVNGASLLSAIATGVISEERLAVFSRNHDFVDRQELPTHPEHIYTEFGCCDGRRKVMTDVEHTKASVYDLENDPAELNSTVLASPDKLLNGLHAEMDEAIVGEHSLADYRLMRERLQALGYL